MDYQGNPNKKQDNKPEKKIEKVVTGEVITKPKSIGRKFKDIFFGGDLKNAARFVTADVILPALRDTLVDAITNGARRVVYGDSMYRRGRPYEYRPRVSYNNPYVTPRQVYDPRDPRTYAYPRDPRDRANLPDQPGRYRPERPEANQIILQNRSDAENVAEGLIDIVEKYGEATLGDLYDLMGLQTNPIDNNWGWTVLRNLEVRQVRDGYLIDLPQMEPIQQ
jgi:hypothetical protein